MHSQSLFLSPLALFLAMCCSSVLAQPAKRAVPASRSVCLVSEFRTIGLQIHDPSERSAKAGDWLKSKGAACSASQLAAIVSNRAAWMGTSDSPILMGLVDGIIEAKVAVNPGFMAQLAASKPEDVRPASVAESVSVSTSAARIAGQAGAPVLPVLVQAGLPRPVAVQVPPGSGAPSPVPPKVQKFYEESQRQAISEFFTRNRGAGICPPGLVLINERCDSAVSDRGWKYGEALAGDVVLKDLATALLDKLGPVPAGHRFIQVAGDILLINIESRQVVDAVLNLGQVAPRR